MPQNKSHAVMAQRTEAKDSLDDFPTPPWATRALLKVLADRMVVPPIAKWSVLEPACGRGHMARTLNETFQRVTAYDIRSYGYRKQLKPRDFLDPIATKDKYDWVITNPPFNRAEEFARQAFRRAKIGVALFVRSTFTESSGRYVRLFRPHPPSVVAQFTERVVLHKGKLVHNGSTATAYCWIIWEMAPADLPIITRYVWIPPCRKRLERANDYL